MIHPLEPRRMLNATLDANGLLTINGSAGDDTINVSLDGANLSVSIAPEGFAQTFTAASVTGILVMAGDGNDRVSINHAVNAGAEIQGGAGNDTITGGGGADNIRAEDGDDLIDGGPGADSLAGDAGRDTLTYASRTNAVSVTLDDTQNDGETGENDVVEGSVDIVIGGAGNDTISSVGQTDPKALYGGPGADTLTGGAGDARLHGGFGDDNLTGGAGNNALVGGFGRDSMSGGGGTDGVTYYYAPAAVTVTPNGLAASGMAGESDTVGADVEVVVGSRFGDTLLSSPAFANFVKGLAGNDTITALGGGDTLWGGDGDDSLLANNSSADELDGGTGTDAANTDTGTDTVTTVP